MIIGGGIGGLCLAQGLKRAGVGVAVYERDRTPETRLQGYRLNIEPVGARALNACLPEYLWSLLLATAGDSGQPMGVFDERLNELMREDANPASDSPLDATHSISRITLRRLLLDGLAGEVMFDKTFVRYEMADGGKVTAFFADGTSATADVLVGADGVGSRVRKQFLPHAREIDTAGVGIAGKLPLNAETESWVPAGLLGGKSMILPRKDFLFTAVFRKRERTPEVDERLGLARSTAGLPMQAHEADVLDQDYLMWAFVGHRSTFPSNLTSLGHAALAALARDRMGGWHPALRRLPLESGQDGIEIFEFRAAAPVRPWQSANVTLLGDAIHAMPPVGGVGGNIALQDASRLCAALIEAASGRSTLGDALSSYEAGMLKYGFEAVRQTRLYLQLAISPSRLLRCVAKMFFRVCGSVPALRRAVFQD
jgi:2-polyprenyl-6-methoxyphenol hydroxylase-like FAD-dependent oxidoreductase